MAINDNLSFGEKNRIAQNVRFRLCSLLLSFSVAHLLERFFVKFERKQKKDEAKNARKIKSMIHFSLCTTMDPEKSHFDHVSL